VHDARDRPLLIELPFGREHRKVGGDQDAFRLSFDAPAKLNIGVVDAAEGEPFLARALVAKNGWRISLMVWRAVVMLRRSRRPPTSAR
jgi:hypothetical protein